MSFTDLICWPSPRDKVYRLDWGYKSASGNDIEFKILYCPEREGDYVEKLSTVNTYADVYVEEAKTSFLDESYFKIAAYNAYTKKIESSSDPVASSIVPSRRDFLDYREMLRRTSLDIYKYIGKRDGYLLRAKKYGEKASNINYILDEPLGEEDLASFGRKYKGGFHRPIQMKCGYIKNEKGQQEAPKVVELGITDPRPQIGLVKMYYPYARPLDDVWVNADTNDRYIIQTSQIHVFRGLPVKQTLGISLLPKTDPAYDVEIIRFNGEAAYA